MPMPEDLPQLRVNKDNPLLEKDRISTGIFKLDVILQGGLKNNSSYLLQGKIDHQRLFCLHFADGNPETKILYITVDLPHAKIEEQALRSYMELKNLIFIDMFSRGKQSNNVFYIGIKEHDKLNEVLKGLHAKHGKEFRLVIDNIEALQQEDPLFYQSLIKELYVGIKNLGGCMLAISGEQNYGIMKNFDSSIKFGGTVMKIDEIEIGIDYRADETGLEIL